MLNYVKIMRKGQLHNPVLKLLSPSLSFIVKLFGSLALLKEKSLTVVWEFDIPNLNVASGTFVALPKFIFLLHLKCRPLVYLPLFNPQWLLVLILLNARK